MNAGWTENHEQTPGDSPDHHVRLRGRSSAPSSHSRSGCIWLLLLSQPASKSSTNCPAQDTASCMPCEANRCHPPSPSPLPPPLPPISPSRSSMVTVCVRISGMGRSPTLEKRSRAFCGSIGRWPLQVPKSGDGKPFCQAGQFASFDFPNIVPGEVLNRTWTISSPPDPHIQQTGRFTISVKKVCFPNPPSPPPLLVA